MLFGFTHEYCDVFRIVNAMDRKRINHNNLIAINNNKSRKRDIVRRLHK